MTSGAVAKGPVVNGAVAKGAVAKGPVAKGPVAGEDGVPEMVARGPLRLYPEPRRVIALPFVPGEEMPIGDSRATSVIERILDMDDVEVKTTLAETVRRYASRHREIDAVWSAHFALARRRLTQAHSIDADRAMLIGAYFTHEFSLEAAALFNPSMVAHPDQSGLGPGEARFVMSLRAVGEGHISSIEFRTGTVGPSGQVALDDPGTFVETGVYSAGPFNRDLFHAKLQADGGDDEAAGLVLDRLAPHFGSEELEGVITALHLDLRSRAAVRNAVERVHMVAANNYTVEFPATTPIGERVLWPHGPSEIQGMEDARFTRFVHDTGDVCYIATYTAFDQVLVAPQLLSTEDFRRFTVSQLSGPFATNKGMALFPRKVGGRYMALSRWDREHLAVAVSDDSYDWSEATTLDLGPAPWELVQVGNCGSPIETAQGWLVLTHGVGPMREYAIGAMLLDLEDPRHLIASLPRPLLVADETEREGYVPNVLYSCGGLVHGQFLVLPYGFSDSGVGFATIDMVELLSRLAALK